MLNRKLILVFVFTVISLQLAAMVLRIDSWPLSSFPMFSRLNKVSEAGDFEVIGIRTDGNKVKIPTPMSQALSGIYTHLIHERRWDKVRDQVLEIYTQAQSRDPGLLDVQMINIVYTRAIPASNGGAKEITFRSELMLTIDPVTGIYNVATH